MQGDLKRVHCFSQVYLTFFSFSGGVVVILWFPPAGFHDRDGQQYCQQCFLTLFASRCQGCSEPILENYISALNSLWHPQCFVCRVSFCHLISSGPPIKTLNMTWNNKWNNLKQQQAFSLDQSNLFSYLNPFNCQ